MAYLINITVGYKKTAIPVQRATLLIGRNDEADLNLGSNIVSQNHASIVYDGQDYYLRDNGSTNGSFVNEEPVTEARLQHMDIVRFGPYRFIFDLEGTMGMEENKAVPVADPPPSHQGRKTDHARHPERSTIKYDLKQEELSDDGQAMAPLKRPPPRASSLQILTKGFKKDD